MDVATLLLLVLLFAVFYFVLIRPQQRQRRQLMELQQSIEPGTKVMTNAGLLATVVAVEGDEVLLEVAPGVTNRYVRRAIANVIPPQESSNDSPDGDGAQSPEPTQQRPEDDRTNGNDFR